MTPEVRPAQSLDSISDGDTPTFIIDTGLDTLRRIAVRLSVVDCPEKGDPGAAEATAFSAAWIAERNGHLDVAAHRTRTGRYHMSFARIVADVYDRRNGDSLSSALLHAGHAVVWS